ncbi:MAG TPA: penicillin-binding transpeptidase domain-containing protein [Aggregatilineales bacterium]|nr:penicillin-binding transpeptidase domain-containing protein [Aggregatilineales bacterium]
MGFERQINRLLIGILMAFISVGIAGAYWAIVGPDTILLREDNPRRVEAEARVLRGTIEGRNGTLLAESTADSTGRAVRRYLLPAMSSALGYFSLRYGVGGAEAAYDNLLSGNDQPQNWQTFIGQDLLHRAREGTDIRLTFDTTIQTELQNQLADYRGSGIVLNATNGEVLALISLPTFDPNTLDADWDLLTQAEDKPFFNRALQGNYQPGGLLQIPLLAGALLSNTQLDKLFVDADRPVQVPNAELRCLVSPQSPVLTLGEAFIYGCPAPFEALINTLGVDPIEAIFRDFQLDTPPTLPGFLPPAESEPVPLQLSAETLVPAALGQGQVTITPLEAAIITAALTQNGNAPEPITLLETRLPGSSRWEPFPHLQTSIPMMTSTVAASLRELLIQSVNEGTAQPAQQDGLVIGGQVALAYAGDETQVWFIGFTTGPNGQTIVTAIALENTADIYRVARIGGEILAFAANQLSA